MMSNKYIRLLKEYKIEVKLCEKNSTLRNRKALGRKSVQLLDEGLRLPSPTVMEVEE